VLVATDVAARGIDVLKISHVINYDMPGTIDAYTHRTGRTGRALQTGEAYTFVGGEDAVTERAIRQLLGVRLKYAELEGLPAEIRVESKRPPVAVNQGAKRRIPAVAAQWTATTDAGECARLIRAPLLPLKGEAPRLPVGLGDRYCRACATGTADHISRCSCSSTCPVC
jgi:hypothetical protein